MLFMSENDLKQYFGDVIRSVARELKVKDWEWLSHNELLEKIQQHQNKSVSEKLQSLFDTYMDWYSFHVKIDKEEKQGKLSPDEHSELIQLILNRDNAREELLKILRFGSESIREELIGLRRFILAMGLNPTKGL